MHRSHSHITNLEPMNTYDQNGTKLCCKSKTDYKPVALIKRSPIFTILYHVPRSEIDYNFLEGRQKTDMTLNYLLQTGFSFGVDPR